MILKYNGILFKLTNTIDKDIEYFSAEEKTAFRWYVVKYWHRLLCIKHKTDQQLHEFSKLSIGDKDSILTEAYMALFTNRPTKSASAKCKEILT
jgi:hypothetical protein